VQQSANSAQILYVVSFVLLISSVANANLIATSLDCNEPGDFEIVKTAKKTVKRVITDNRQVTMLGIGDCSPVAACGVRMGFVSHEATLNTNYRKHLC